MPVNTEDIKKAFDDFEDEDYVSAKETLTKEIGAAKDAFLRDKLGLKEPEATSDDDDQGDDE